MSNFNYIIIFRFKEIQFLIIIFFNRRTILEKKLADADVSEEDQNNLLKFLEKKETEYMRLQRHKMGADDFELLTMIGKGAFGEVYFYKMSAVLDQCSVLSLCKECGCYRLSFLYLLLKLIFWELLKVFVIMQVRVCREKTTGQVYAMKKLKKSEMLRRGQVFIYSVVILRFCALFISDGFYHILG